MRMCNLCGESKELDKFSPQKTNPSKLYSWCDACRKLHIKPVKTADYHKEISEMRAKARQLRKFNDTQAVELLHRHQTDKVSYKELAKEYGVAISTISSTIKRVKAGKP